MSGSSRRVFTFVNIFIGIVIELVGSVIFGGEQGPYIIALTVICTAGVSLVIWIPLAAVLGWIVTSLFADKKLEAPHIASTEEKSQVVLVSYLQRVLDSGIDIEEAVNLLKSNGWKENNIRDALLTIDAASQG